MAVTFPPDLVHNLNIALKRLRDAREDGDPMHVPERCRGCAICVHQRHFDRLTDQLPRRETP